MAVEEVLEDTPAASATTIFSTEVRFDLVTTFNIVIILIIFYFSRARKLQHQRPQPDPRPLVLRDEAQPLPRREAVQGAPRQVLVQPGLQQRLHKEQGQEERRSQAQDHMEHDGEAGRAP